MKIQTDYELLALCDKTNNFAWIRMYEACRPKVVAELKRKKVEVTEEAIVKTIIESYAPAEVLYLRTTKCGECDKDHITEIKVFLIHADLHEHHTPMKGDVFKNVKLAIPTPSRHFFSILEFDELHVVEGEDQASKEADAMCSFIEESSLAAYEMIQAGSGVKH